MRAMPDLRILITGFEPFGGDSVNPSWLVAQHLSRASIAGAQVQALQLPCVFGVSAQVLVQALAQHQPDVVLALGLAQGRQGRGEGAHHISHATHLDHRCAFRSRKQDAHA